MHLVLLLFFLLLSPLNLLAVEPRSTEREMHELANHFLAQGDYYRAVSEYERQLFYFPQGSLTQAAHLGLVQAYRQGGELQQAINYLEALPDKSDKARLLLALCYLDLSPSDPYPLREKQRQKGLEQLIKVEGERAQGFVAEAAKLPLEGANQAWAAGALSTVIPGLGSAYLGRYKEASYAAFFTISFGLATTEAYRANRNDLAAGFGIFALIFYGGSIYSAVNSAHKLADLKQAKAFDELRGKYGIWYSPEGIMVERRF